MRMMQNNILDMILGLLPWSANEGGVIGLDAILGGSPWSASETGAPGLPGIDGAIYLGTEEQPIPKTKSAPKPSPAECISAMSGDQFRAFKDRVARGECGILDAPAINQAESISGGGGSPIDWNAPPHKEELWAKPSWDEEHPNMAALKHAFGLDEEGLWWTDDGLNLLLHPEGIVEGLGHELTSIPGYFFGGMESIKRAIDCVALSNEVDLEAFHDYISEGFQEKAAEWDFLVYQPQTRGSYLVGLGLGAPAGLVSEAGKSLSGLDVFEDSPNARGAFRFAGDLGGGLVMGKMANGARNMKTPPSLAAENHASQVQKFWSQHEEVPSQGWKEGLQRKLGPDRKFSEKELLSLFDETKKSAPPLIETLPPEEIARHWNRLTSLEKDILSKSVIKNVNGRPVAFLKGTRVDPLVQNSQGLSNLDLMINGRPPVAPDQQMIQLHHGGQMNDGILFPLFRKSHTLIQSPLDQSEINRNAFKGYRSKFWKQGGNNYGP